MRTPAFTKPARFRVTTAKPWTSAVVAMRLSLIGMPFPVVRSCASSSAHLSPMSASQGRQNPESQFAENDGIDGDARLRREAMPRLANRAPVSSAHSERWRPPGTSQRIRRLRAAQPHAGQGDSPHSRPARRRTPARFDAVHLPKFRRQNDLALGGDGSLHVGKMSSYLGQCLHLTASPTHGSPPSRCLRSIR
jgi:hypothetical protein